MSLSTNKKYYDIAGEASLSYLGHPGLEYLHSLCRKASKVLDLGCGEGTRLNTLVPKGVVAFGVDVNDYAIKRAKAKYPKRDFKVYDGHKVPYPDNYFDLVYSTFVLEHTQDPQNYINEAVRVLKKDGFLVIICPNFGAPNRRSPNSTENPVNKLLKGFISDFNPGRELTFTKVKPKETYREIDDDTTVEPYLYNLKNYLQSLSLKTIRCSSLWELEAKSVNPRKLLFKYLGRLGLFPFVNWGPQIFLVARK